MQSKESFRNLYQADAISSLFVYKSEKSINKFASFRFCGSEWGKRTAAEGNFVPIMLQRKFLSPTQNKKFAA